MTLSPRGSGAKRRAAAFRPQSAGYDRRVPEEPDKLPTRPTAPGAHDAPDAPLANEPGPSHPRETDDSPRPDTELPATEPGSPEDDPGGQEAG